MKRKRANGYSWFNGIEQLEQRRLLTRMVFVEQPIEPANLLGRGHDGNIVESIHLADADGDGDLDVFFANYTGGISWQENEDGKGGLGEIHLVGEIPLANAISTKDMDGDGDLDVLAVGGEEGDTLPTSSIRWFENINGSGRFRLSWISDPFSPNSVDVPVSISAQDIDNDGDFDLLGIGSIFGQRGVFLYPIVDGEVEDPPYLLVQLAHITSAAFGDLDSDGNLDLVVTNHDQIALYVNDDGLGLFELAEEFGNIGADHVVLTDIDGDGDNDIVATSTTYGELRWYRNDEGSFEEERVVDDDLFQRLVVAEEIDRDGDRDLVVAGRLGISYLENDGHGNFSPTIIVEEEPVDYVTLGDIDNDGDQDLIALIGEFRRLTWFENRLVGDSNNDGRFDSSDLVKVFQAGKYEDGVSGNTSFDEGDWNQDGDFDTADLVFAFQSGTYSVSAKRLELDDQFEAAIDLVFGNNDDNAISADDVKNRSDSLRS